MVDAMRMAFFGAAGIAMCSALFGAALARMLWADDLKQAQKIDEIRSRTEVALRSTIDSLEKQLAIYKAR